MNLDFIILYISLPPQFCVIHKFDKPAFKLMTKSLHREGPIHSPDVQLWAVPSCAPDAEPQLAPCPTEKTWMCKMVAFVLLEPTHKRTVKLLSRGAHLPRPSYNHNMMQSSESPGMQKTQALSTESRSHAQARPGLLKHFP